MNRDFSSLTQLASKLEGADDSLTADPRWQMVLRIADSQGMARAHQLREFLLYSSRWALENPGKPLSEYDIAQNVMGRRKDFDAAQDNIVRVQASHLRRKLETYFAAEGAREQIAVVLPKGAYTPQFLIADPKPPAISTETGPSLPVETPHIPARTPQNRLANPWIWVGALGFLCLLMVTALVAAYIHSRPQTASQPKNQAILAPLLRNGKPVTIVLPDLGLSEVQNLLGREIDIQQYASGGFPEGSLQDIQDPHLKQALSYIGTRRAISYSELNALLELVRVFQSRGVTPTVRFARDIHVRDLGVGNVVLIGSRRSNLWASLFVDRTNFRFVENPQTREFYFENRSPQTGEQKSYMPTYTPHGGDGYIDVALFSNTTNSGYMLLVNGSDAEVNESAIRYLIEGSLPTALQNSLNRPQLASFEIFLSGRHLINESDDSIQIVGSRESFF